MPRRVHIGELPIYYETTADPNTIILRFAFWGFATELSGLQGDFPVTLGLTDTATEIEVKRRDALLAELPRLYPTLGAWSGSEVVQCQFRRN